MPTKKEGMLSKRGILSAVLERIHPRPDPKTLEHRTLEGSTHRSVEVGMLSLKEEKTPPLRLKGSTRGSRPSKEALTAPPK